MFSETFVMNYSAVVRSRSKVSRGITYSTLKMEAAISSKALAVTKAQVRGWGEYG
jgi:hypothetical protein